VYVQLRKLLYNIILQTFIFNFSHGEKKPVQSQKNNILKQLKINVILRTLNMFLAAGFSLQ